MGNLIYLLKNREKHAPWKMVVDMAEVAFKINALYDYTNDSEYFSNGDLKRVAVFFADDIGSVRDGNHKRFLLDILGINTSKRSPEAIKRFDFLRPGEQLSNLAVIEDLDEGAFELFYRFSYEYLKLNPDEYFWFDLSKWVFGWEEMQKLSKYSYDKDWLFKDPGLLE